MSNKASKGIPGKIMIVRHAEKPGPYGDKNAVYFGVDQNGSADEKSLVTLGWQRAGGLASLFAPNKPLQATASSLLEPPTAIYASDPIATKKEPSQRPFQTVSALASKLGITVDTKYKGEDFKDMVSEVLGMSKTKDVVLISWQHQDILAKAAGDDCIVAEIVAQTQSSLENLPTKPWLDDRYDMVLVLDQVKNGKYMRFTQVPQMLLAGDSSVPLK
ncbi:MAG: hypothetical protein HY850_09295 [Betaproteobacteria bacterium]|nr:hypothetical protein [Betaproteobacteria bacterium]